MPEQQTVAWPTDEGIWMGKLPDDLGWFPLRTTALESDALNTTLILAQWPESKDRWPYTVKECHPVNEWRRPTDEERERARRFYGLKEA